MDGDERSPDETTRVAGACPADQNRSAAAPRIKNVDAKQFRDTPHIVHGCLQPCPCRRSQRNLACLCRSQMARIASTIQETCFLLGERPRTTEQVMVERCDVSLVRKSIYLLEFKSS